MKHSREDVRDISKNWNDFCNLEVILNYDSKFKSLTGVCWLYTATMRKCYIYSSFWMMTNSKFVLKKVVHKRPIKNMKGQTLSHMDRILLGNVIMNAEQRFVTFHYVNYRWIKRIFWMFNPHLKDMIQFKYRL